MKVIKNPTDKAFLIAKPMGKAAWTKRFAAGWERGTQRTVLVSSVRAGDGNWPAVFVRNR